MTDANGVNPQTIHTVPSPQIQEARAVRAALGLPSTSSQSRVNAEIQRIRHRLESTAAQNARERMRVALGLPPTASTVQVIAAIHMMVSACRELDDPSASEPQMVAWLALDSRSIPSPVQR